MDDKCYSETSVCFHSTNYRRYAPEDRTLLLVSGLGMRQVQHEITRERMQMKQTLNETRKVACSNVSRAIQVVLGQKHGTIFSDC
jgi:hypothetical protein